MNGRCTAIYAMALAALLTTPMPGEAVESREVLLFQPGQSAWQWIVVPSRHEGARRLREGRTCLYCHEGEERVIGAAIGRGERLEPDPMPGMLPIVALDLGMQRDGDTLNIRLSWPAVSAERRVGAAAVPARITVMFGSDAIPATAIAGCWIACHTDLPSMPDAKPGLTKYLPNSREGMGATGGGAVRGAAELADEIAQGRIFDYLQVELDGGEAARVVEGYILDARHEHEGTAATARARLVDGRWTVEIVRPLSPGGDRLALETGRLYTLGFALHANHAEGRRHYVAYPLSMRLDSGDADIIVRGDH